MFRRGSSRAVSPKKEVRKAPQKVASRDENTAPVEAERPKVPVKRASVKDIYDEHKEVGDADEALARQNSSFSPRRTI